MNIFDHGTTNFIPEEAEQLLHLAASRRCNELRSLDEPTAYQLTIRWIKEKCTAEEQALLDDFYIYERSVNDCENSPDVETVRSIVERFAADMGLHD